MLQTLVNLDLQLSQQLRLRPGHPMWRPAALLAHSGDSWLWAIGVGLFWLVGLAAGPEAPGGARAHYISAVFEISIVTQALFVFALKSVIKRRRPDGDWGRIYRSFDPHSFPSGHATRAVLLATLAAGLGPGWFAWLMAVWAPLVCASRVLTGVHYLSDILGGMLLGLLMGLAFLALAPTWQAWFPFLFTL
jgi:undecaprenyl-diphosphatase